MRTLTALFTTFLPMLPLSASAQTEGEVRLTLQEWLELERRIGALEEQTPAPLPVAFEARSLDARFDRGVLRGRLEVRVTAYAAPAEVPLIHTEASLSKVAVDGEKAVAVRRGAFYAVVLKKPGEHRIRVDLVVGEERARFARAFALAMPPAPISDVRVDLPERDLDVAIDGGVVLKQTETRGRTVVTGAFDARDRLSVTWRRRAVHDTERHREMETGALALIGLEDELVRSRTRFEYRMIAGETDRLEIALPDGLEVTGVQGGAVLQWYTEPKRLIVLLKHLVTDEVAVLVEAQSPLEDRTKATLSFPSPADASLREAVMAVEGRAGFAIEVDRIEGAREVGVREVPERLSELSNKPLLFAYEADAAWPKLSLSVQRNAEIALTQAVIDDLQASTVVTEEGVEVTKLRLYVRNNTRQYLELTLPDRASITHAMIDGVPFHPAVSAEGKRRILVPLRQSERLVDGVRYHRVRAGETLGELSLRYLGTTDRWQAILDANQLVGPQDLAVGQTIQIPSEAAGVKFEESNFVVELAYKRQVPSLGMIGRHAARLPVLDIPVMAATWHFYFPNAHTPLTFSSNLTQLTAVRYDPLRRIRWFIEEALQVEDAWASIPQKLDTYENILSSRKRIYKQEQRRQVTEALSSFPLVGRRFRFERVLLGDEQAKLELVYLNRAAVPFVRWGALLLALLLSFRLLRTLRVKGAAATLRSPDLVTALVGLGGLLFLGHHVLGVHRFTLHGVDAGLALAILPAVLQGRVRSVSEKVRAGLSFERAFSGRTILQLFVSGLALTMALTYPLLLSSILFLVLIVLAVRTREVADA